MTAISISPIVVVQRLYSVKRQWLVAGEVDIIHMNRDQKTLPQITIFSIHNGLSSFTKYMSLYLLT
jgi:hypothetical protein